MSQDNTNDSPPGPDYRSLLRSGLAKMEELQGRLDALRADKTEPLAVVGIGCRFPGSVDGPDAFWKLLCEGRDGRQEVPSDRWDVDAFYDPDPDAPGKMTTRYGCFLDQVDLFEPEFFSISPREAVSMDPQQRLLLEATWEALEHAGITPRSLRGSRTGVFIGISSGDFTRILGARQRQDLDAYFGTGIAHSTATGRLSFLLGLQGPNMAVDTACSSSLVAMHLAGQALRNRECNLALVGGVNVILSPDLSINFSKARMLSIEGRCRTFDADADGYARGEGVGILVLRRLSDALSARDQILALVRGSAVNHDGRSSGLTVPNGPAQVKVIRQALDHAGLAPEDVTYVEAHGTATPLGDPIEIQAIGEAYGQGRPKDQPLLVGSVKTNIGHLEAGAGISGVIKAVLCAAHGQIPAHLNLTRPNPHVSWQELPIRIPTTLIPWDGRDGARIAGVSSFGFSGTNAHVLIESPPPPESSSPDLKRPVQVLTIAAKTHSALEALSRRYLDRLAGTPEGDFADLCFTANTGRTLFAHRLAISATSASEACALLGGFLAGEDDPQCVYAEVKARTAPGVVFVFGGQQKPMLEWARELGGTETQLRAALERSWEALDSLALPPLADNGVPPQTDGVGAAIQVIIQVALAQLWQRWGVEPVAVAGEGIGLVAAACFAGVMSLEEAGAVVSGHATARPRPPVLTKPWCSVVRLSTGESLDERLVDPAFWRSEVYDAPAPSAARNAAPFEGIPIFLHMAPQAPDPTPASDSVIHLPHRQSVVEPGLGLADTGAPNRGGGAEETESGSEGKGREVPRAR